MFAKISTACRVRAADLAGYIRSQMFKPEYPDYCKQ